MRPRRRRMSIPVWDPLTRLWARYIQRDQTAEMAGRWSAAALQDPELARDVIRIGGLLDARPVDMIDGIPSPVPLDALQLAHEAGRRELTLDLLALMGVDAQQMLDMLNDQ